MNRLLQLFGLILVAVAHAQTRSVLNVGTAANDGTGDSIRAAFLKINGNTSNLWATVYTNGAPFPAVTYLTRSWEINGGAVGSVTNSVSFHPLYTFEAAATNLTLVGIDSGLLQGNTIEIRADTNLLVLTPHVVAGTATTGQVLTLSSAATGESEFATAAFLPLAGGTLTGPVKIGSAGTQFSKLFFGTTTLVAGSATVTNATITASTHIVVSVKTAGGTQGFLSTTRSAGVSFTITSTSGTDTSTVAYIAIEP